MRHGKLTTTKLAKFVPRILVTGGPTRAYLDPVRFLSNVSTGALAYEVCCQIRRRGNPLVAVIGPSGLPFEKLRLNELSRVETNDEMRREILRLCRSFKPTAAVFSAAVLDFAPELLVSSKVTSSTPWNIRLVPTPKIVDEIGVKFPWIRRIAFKLESERLGKKARSDFGFHYLKSKGLHGLCLNFLADVNDKSHRAYLFDENGFITEVHTKREIASWIAKKINVRP